MKQTKERIEKAVREAFIKSGKAKNLTESENGVTLQEYSDKLKDIFSNVPKAPSLSKRDTLLVELLHNQTVIFVVGDSSNDEYIDEYLYAVGGLETAKKYYGKKAKITSVKGEYDRLMAMEGDLYLSLSFIITFDDGMTFENVFESNMKLVHNEKEFPLNDFLGFF